MHLGENSHIGLAGKTDRVDEPVDVTPVDARGHQVLLGDRGRHHSPGFIQVCPPQCGPGSGEVSEGSFLVDMSPDHVWVGARGNEVGGDLECARCRVGVLESPGVGDNRGVKTIGDHRGDLPAKKLE